MLYVVGNRPPVEAKITEKKSIPFPGHYLAPVPAARENEIKPNDGSVRFSLLGERGFLHHPY